MLDTNELLTVAREMRERKVSHGKHPSPTLIAWAERIEKAAELPERIVLWSPAPKPRGPDWFFVAERAKHIAYTQNMPVYRTLDAVEPVNGPDPRIDEALEYLLPRIAQGSVEALAVKRILTQPRS